MLELADVTAGYGRARAIDGVSFAVGAGDALAILGRNGAGKSTTMKTAMGLLPAWSGRIRVADTDVTGFPPDRIAHLGIGYVPEDRRVFTELSVLENLATGAKPGPDGGQTWDAARVLDLFPEIARRRHAAAGTLSGGERQMLAIARALMGNPSLLLLDEPSEGLAPVVVHRLADALRALRNDGIALLISEQNRHLAEAVADRVIILETGRVRFEGRFGDLDADPGIAGRYLGL